MKELFNKLVAEYGLEVKKDPIDGSPLACYRGRVVMYILSLSLIDVLDEDGSFYSTREETQCRAWLNDIIPVLKKRDLERKLIKMERDFE
ncbi:MAG: hypothetical protein J6V44_17655 [Methanobrevibacter sp.]|nr:hypothetical protein [Methanobrevibacter sp.]